MNATWMIPFIILGGALQTCGAAMNSQLYKHMLNPWLASAISAAVVAVFFLKPLVLREVRKGDPHESAMRLRVCDA